MNYIKHLNGVFFSFSKDNRLNPTHISLYMALFQFWNINRFSPSFHINREEIMQHSKIGSVGTYHRCIKQLHHWKYLQYFPSHNPYKGSKVSLFKFDTTFEQPPHKHATSIGQESVRNTNKNKHIKNDTKAKLPKDQKEVADFLEREFGNSEISVEMEAKKFFNHYQANGWKVGGRAPMENWQASASNWLLKAQEIKQNKGLGPLVQKTDNLRTTKIKDYNMPL
tara:strand:+ start:738 stop:1409 length:672 start_codon:yes stop_codon:yes gene_type:complete